MHADKRPYQICTRCVMDTSDPEITFDDRGQCNYCQRFDRELRQEWFPDEEGAKRLGALVADIKKECANQEYDCIVGLSGGSDSSYAALVARRQLGLRVLAVHVDAGWNSELAVANIENIVKRLDIDLHTHVVDWDEMRDLQLAFMRSGVANQDVPQDHAFFAALYAFAAKSGIRWVLSGGNIATESVLPPAWGYNAMDLRHLRSIHRAFGKRKLRTYPTCSFFQYYVGYPYIHRMRVLRPLNFMPYVREDAQAMLERDLGYRYYGTKHGESRFTKFFQNYWLVERFGFDKRRAHVASLVLSGQMSREDALASLTVPAYRNASELAEDKAFVAKKLGISAQEFEDILAAPLKTYRDYDSNEALFELKNRVRPILQRIGLGAARK